MDLFKRMLIVYKPVSPCFSIANTASSYLRSRGVEVYALTIDDLSPSIDKKILEPSIDVVLSIGGDGTFIRTSKMFPDYLIIPFPCGRRNTYYEHSLPGIETVLDNALRGLFHLEFIPLFKTCHLELCRVFMNDAVLISSDLGKAAKYGVKIRTHCTTSDIFFEGDGLIVSTAYGSGGHNLSARGPLLIPNMDSLVITPINPIQLNTPSLVVPSLSTIEINIGNTTTLYLDGDRIDVLDKNTTLNIQHGLRYIKVARFSPTRSVWRSVLEHRGRIY